MSWGYILSYDKINHVDMHSDSFTLRRYDEKLVTLPKAALGAMITNHEDILLGLEDMNKPVKKYWSNPDVAIYTKEALAVESYKPFKTVRKKVLCISKPPVDITLTAEMFQQVVLRATILRRIGDRNDDEDDCDESKVSPEYKLASTKSILFHPHEKFSILDEVNPNQFEIKLKVLISLIMRRKKILADLYSQESTGENVYDGDGFLTLKTIPFENSRAFCFCLDDIEEGIILRKHTFDLMLHVALGAPSWNERMKEDGKIKQVRMMCWKNTPFNIITQIKFTPNSEIFTMFNDTYHMVLILPRNAIEAMLNSKQEIMNDLEAEAVAPTGEKDFINEYWIDDIFAIRTGVIYNLYREIDCNVIKFMRVKNDECVFVTQKQGLLQIFEHYLNQESNSE